MAILTALGDDALAITLGQVDDFDSGDLSGWTAGGGGTPNPPAVLAGAGPAGAGDFALVISTNGLGSGPGSRLVGLNFAQWTGDYSAAGVTSISVDLSSPNNVPLNVRLALQGGAGSAVTPDVLVPAGTGVFNNFTFSLAPADLIALDGADVGALLADVTQFRILHNPSPSIQGATVGSPFAASLIVDNITAVPEPSSLAMMAAISGLVLFRRVRSQPQGDWAPGFRAQGLLAAPLKSPCSLCPLW